MVTNSWIDHGKPWSSIHAAVNAIHELLLRQTTTVRYAQTYNRKAYVLNLFMQHHDLWQQVHIDQETVNVAMYNVLGLKINGIVVSSDLLSSIL